MVTSNSAVESATINLASSPRHLVPLWLRDTEGRLSGGHNILANPLGITQGVTLRNAFGEQNHLQY